MKQINNFFDNTKTIIALILITAIGLYLRLKNLGDLGFRWDEDLTSLATKAILENGYPLFPTGMIYPRSGIFLYFHALSAQFLGFSEFSLRLPAALFSAATVPLAYFVSAKFFGRVVGILVATFVAFSVWEIEMARNARMYAPFAFFYILTVYYFYYFYIENVNANHKYIVLFLALFTITIHQLGFSLAILYLFPIFIKECKYKNYLNLLINFVVVIFFFLFWVKFIQSNMRIPYYFYQESVEIANQLLGKQPSIYYQISSVFNKVINHFLLPNPELIKILYRVSSFAFAVISIAYFVSSFLYFKTNADKSKIVYILLFLFVMLCYFHQYNLVLSCFMLYLLHQNVGLYALKKYETRKLIYFALVTFLLWTVFGLIFINSDHYVLVGESNRFNQVVKTLLDYPNFYVVWVFVLERPFMSILAMMGFAWTFHVASQQPRNLNATFLLFAFLLPVFATGLIDSRYNSFRYVLHLDILYFMLVAIGIINWKPLVDLFLTILRNNEKVSQFYWHRVKSLLQSNAASGFVTFIIIAFLLMTDLNPAQAWYLTQREYGKNSFLYGMVNLNYYPDQKTPALYVKENLKDNDLVIVLDSREQFNYIGRADYWVRTDIYDRQVYLNEGELHDIYVGTPLITSLEELKRVLKQNSNRRIWLVASSRMLSSTQALNRDIKDFIKSQSEKVVYVGQDEATKVYRMDFDQSARQ
jgi:4-amino-4-deoxy-L-arabinose transferase-like glycosyltransferase